MKINLVTNTFGKYHRQNIAVDSWNHLKKLYTDSLNLYNMQFKDETDTFEDHYEGVETKFSLRRSSKHLVKNGTKKLPMVYDIIEEGFFDDPDYVIFTNSDVIIMPHLIEYIINEQPDCMAISRLDIEHIDSFDNILNQQVTPVRMEIAGKDIFVFKREWFKEYSNYFSHAFLLGKPYFDPAYAGLMAIFGKKFKLGNDFPPYAFHIHHGTASVDTECPEKDFNEMIFNNEPWFKIANNIIFYNLQYNLCKRKPWGRFIQGVENEQKVQENFFNVMNIHNMNKINYIE